MRIAATAMIALIGLLHVWILVLEMVLWTKPLGLKTFGNTKEKAEASKVLAANQGLYNGFLAAGLLYSLVLSGATALTFQYFFLGCVAVAGIYGGLSAKRSIILVQTAPATLALDQSYSLDKPLD